ncbi:inositol phosphate phosphatase SopB [Endozoicomonas montiporae]|uniref:Phosphatidylinositol-4,5-bisphosphate 4-phosphatase n=1 Tax=Endozoicomonas montiporae CL-33 TaxID=570277 RepID=A0A142BF53_9GAMM|nr:inositol phosphate phosphatase SopB [Endozoicomonas montiporae]AMO57379.1 phosphatidylinositol-4,5-bisphosphate 4-phosphatase [Endozoicomonas montiporae CL-33]
MDGNGSVGGIRNAAYKPLDPAKQDEASNKQRSRINRMVKKIGVKLRIIPKPARASGKRQPAKRALLDRNVEISGPIPKQMSAVKSQAGVAKTATATLDDLMARSQTGNHQGSDVRREFGEVRHQYLNAALTVTEKAISEAENSRGSEQVETLKDIKAGLQQIIADGQFDVTPESISALKNYPQTFASFMDQVGLSGEEVHTAFKEQVAGGDALKSELDSLQFSKPHEEELNAQSTHNHKELFKLQTLQFKAAQTLVAGDLAVARESGNEALQNSLEVISERLDEQFQQLERTVLLKGEEPVSKDEAKVARDQYLQFIKEALVEAGVDASTVDTRFQDAYASQLNDRDWNTVHNEFEHDGRTFGSTQTPASQVQVNGENGELEKLLDYDGNKGVCCIDSKNVDHATNLLRTDFQIDGQTEFTGVRHGIADPYGIKGGGDAKALKAQGARKKAEEILITALSTKPELFRQALKAAETGRDIPTLLTNSISLVTTGVGSSKEAKSQKAQNEAFDFFTNPKNQPVEIEVPGPDGSLRKIRVNFKQSRFNIPVNWGGVGPASLIFGGRRNQARMNNQAIKDLIGKPEKDEDIGGMAGHWLGQYEQKQALLSYKLTAEQNRAEPDKALIEELKQEYGQLAKDKRTIEDLGRQIKEIYRKGTHHHEHKDAYKLAARVALLTHKLGAVPLMNCKSGKDRTGMLDAEIKFLAARIDNDGKVPEPGSLTDDEKALFREMLLKSGNHEVQEMNVGVRGYKTEKIGSITERVSDEAVREEVRGLSKSIRS